MADLLISREDLLVDWNDEDNINVDIKSITLGSNKKISWKCHVCSYVWSASPNNRSHGSGCPYCSGKVVWPGHNDICTTEPDVAAEWNYEKNGDRRPENYSRGCTSVFWWVHKCGYEWEASINNRTSGKGSGCPYCYGNAVWEGHNDLATMCPELLEEWNYEKNGELLPTRFRAGSQTKVWWKCKKCSYEWRAAINKRSNGRGCPVCAGKIVWVGHNDLATMCPDVASEWFYEKNSGHRPEEYTKGSNASFWWRCQRCSNIWKQVINLRTRGAGCPNCMGKKISETLMRKAIRKNNTLASKYPELAEEWNQEKNGDLTAYDVAPMSNHAFWWKCGVCNYEWHAIVSNRVQGRGCPNCAHIHQTSVPEQIIFYYVRQMFNDAINGYVSEFFSPFSIDIFIPSLNIGIEYDGERWHRDAEKDMRKSICLKRAGITLIRLREMGCPTLKDDSIQIKVNNPEYRSYDYLNITINELFDEISKLLGKCVCVAPDCTNVSRKIASIYQNKMIENSLGSQNEQLATEWDYEKNGTLTPYNVKLKSNKKVNWICAKCGYQWEATICDRAEGRGCPVCAGRQVMVGYNDMKSKNPGVAKEWNYDKNAPAIPEDFTFGSSKKVWWKCSICNHEWCANIRNRVVLHSGCPKCSRKKRKRSED